jgi:hypothetical protein
MFGLGLVSIKVDGVVWDFWQAVMRCCRREAGRFDGLIEWSEGGEEEQREDLADNIYLCSCSSGGGEGGKVFDHVTMVVWKGPGSLSPLSHLGTNKRARL